MSTFDIEAFEASTESKVTPKVTPKAEPKVCNAEGCEKNRALRSSLCETHKAEADALKLERYKAYRNVIRDAMTLANAVEGDNTHKVLIHLSDGRSGFAYFAKESLPKLVAKASPFTNGLTLKLEGTATAAAFVDTFKASDAIKSEGIKVKAYVRVA